MSLLLAASDSAKVHLTPQTRILAALLAIFFMLLILELIRRDQLQERYSVIWFVAGLGMLIGAAFPGLLELVADAGRRVELAIGRDLQFIRINGTIVGGLAGLVIYLISSFFP